MIKTIPSKEKLTIDDLKSIGLHCNNVVEISAPTFLFNINTFEIIDNNVDSLDGFERLTVRTHRLFPDANDFHIEINYLNNVKQIVWYPFRQPDGDIAYHIRMKIIN